MGIEAVENLQGLDSLSTRPLAWIAVRGVREGFAAISPADIRRISQIIDALSSIRPDDPFTVAMIKPDAFNGRGLPATDKASAAYLRGLIPNERVAFETNFALTKAQAEALYAANREKYSQKFNKDQNEYNPPGVSIFEAGNRFISRGPLTFLLLRGEGVIPWWRELIGLTFPSPDDSTSLRGRHADTAKMPNTLFHGSDSPETAFFELTTFINAFKEFREAAIMIEGGFYDAFRLRSWNLLRDRETLVLQRLVPRRPRGQFESFIQALVLDPQNRLTARGDCSPF